MKLSFYEQVGIVIPGACVLFGYMFIFPGLHDLLARGGFDVGGLGVFVLISYAIGHLVAALGNSLEGLCWKYFGGMPSFWIIGASPRLLSREQVERTERLIRERFANPSISLRETHSGAWYAVFRQIYSDVERYGKPARAETFNGNYGLNRGLCAATLFLSVSLLVLLQNGTIFSLCLLASSVLYAYRADRFGVHYAREVYVQFLSRPEQLKSQENEDKI